MIGFSGLQILDQRILSVNQKLKSSEIQVEIEHFKSNLLRFVNDQKLHFLVLKAFKYNPDTRKVLNELFFNYVEMYPSLKAFYFVSDNHVEYSIFNDYKFQINEFNYEQQARLSVAVEESILTNKIVITRPFEFFDNSENYVFFVIPFGEKGNKKILLAMYNMDEIIKKSITGLVIKEDIIFNIKIPSNKLVFGQPIKNLPGDVLIEVLDTPFGEWKLELLYNQPLQFQYLRKLIWVLGFALMALLVFYMLIVDRKNTAIFKNYQNLKETELLLSFHYEREKVLREIITEIHSSKDIDKLLQYICIKLGTFLAIEQVAFFETGNNMEIKYEYTSPAYKNKLIGVRVPVDTQLYDYLVNKKKVYIFNDKTKDDLSLIEEFEKHIKSLNSIALFPIIHNDMVLGVLGFGTVKKRMWDKEKVEFLNSTISQIALALHQNNLLAELDTTSKTIVESIQQEYFLKNIALIIRTSIDIKEICNTVNSELGLFMNLDRVYIVEYDVDTKSVLPIRKEFRSTEDLIKFEEDPKFRQQFMHFVQNLHDNQKWHQQIIHKSSEFFKNAMQKPPEEVFSKEFEVKSFVTTPITYQNKLFGTLFVAQVFKQRQWSASEAEFLQKVAEQLAIGMYQLKIYDELRRFTDKQVVINKIFEVIRSSIDIDEILWNACNEIGAYINVNRCAILVHDEESKVSEPVRYEYTSHKHLIPGIGAVVDIDPNNNYSFQCVINDKRPFVADYVSGDESAVKFKNVENYISVYGIQSLLLIPIVYSEKVLGSIFLAQTEYSRNWTESDVYFLKSVANQIAIALHQANLFRELNIANQKFLQQYKKEQTIRKILETVRSSLDLEKVYEDLTREICIALNLSRCDIWGYDQDNESFSTISYEYRADETIPSFEGITLSPEEAQFCKRLVEKGHSPFIIDDVQNFFKDNQSLSIANVSGLKSVVVIPIVYQNVTYGLFSVGQVDYYRRWTQDEIEILKIVADQAALVISQVKMYNYVQETSRLKSEFLASVSHELKTPLNSIIVLSELMQNKDSIKSPEEEVELLKIIHSSGEELLSHINNILDMAKVEFSKSNANYELINIKSVMEDIISLIKPLSREKSLELIVNYNENLKEEFYTDKKLIKLIVNNITNNAVKFTSSGYVEINIKMATPEIFDKISFVPAKETEYLFISVKDTGIGIEEKYHKLIFDEFRQLEESEIRKYGGTGLGLAITKKSVNLLEGAIWLTSTPGEGSEFFVIIPVN